MNDEGPFPPALPAVVPSPIGPAVSYSTIRAVTSRAESLLDRLDNKIRKRLASGANDSGMVGAMLETKVRQRLGDQLVPPEQLFQDTHTLLSNQIIGNLAPAVATLEDLTGESATPAVGETMPAATGGPGAGGAGAIPPPIIPPGGVASLRAMRTTPSVPVPPGGDVGQGPVIQCKKTCEIPEAVANRATQAAFQAAINNDPGGLAGKDQMSIIIHPDCIIMRGTDKGLTDWLCCSVGIAGGFWTTGMLNAATQAAQRQLALDGFNFPIGQGAKTCVKTPPVDCTKTPLDPSCPPDCIKHPEDPRCPVLPPTCPPPCIEVTCPAPVINVPPCPPLNLPSCIQIDLCDWKKFCDALTNCIGKAKEDCALDNDTAYTFKDCDHTFGEAQQSFLAGASGPLLQSSTIDDLATAGMALSTSISSDEYGSDQPY